MPFLFQHGMGGDANQALGYIGDTLQRYPPQTAAARESSICSMIALRDRPEPPGPSWTGKYTFVATTMSSRRVSSLSARPTASSEVPEL